MNGSLALSQEVPDAPSIIPSGPGVEVPSPSGDSTGGLEVITQPFLDSDLFSLVQAIASVTGAAVVVVVVFYVIKNITQGAFSFAVRTGAFGAVVAAMLFNLRVPISFAQGLTSVVDQVFAFLLEIANRTGA